MKTALKVFGLPILAFFVTIAFIMVVILVGSNILFGLGMIADTVASLMNWKQENGVATVAVGCLVAVVVFVVAVEHYK